MFIGIRRSFGTKIFIFTTLLVLSVVGFITAKNSLFLRDSLNRQYQSSLVDNTQLLAERLQGYLNRWDTRLGYFVQALMQAAPENQKELADTFLKSENSLLGIQAFRMDESVVPIIESLRGNTSPLDVGRLPQKILNSEIAIFTHPTQSSSTILLRRISIHGVDKPILVSLTFDLKELQPESGEGLKRFLLDENFNDLLSLQSYAEIVNNKDFSDKALGVMKGEIGYGYLGELQNDKSLNFVAYYRLQGYPLQLIIHQDASPIREAIWSFLVEMLQWTLIFVLIAVFLASFMVKNLVANLKALSSATHLVGSGRFDQEVAVRSEDEIGQLSASFNIMTRKIINLLEAEREKAWLDQELTMAQTVQNSFFRDAKIDHEAFGIKSFYKPAAQCGGDWWAHFSIDADRELVLIGDATGHGISSALVTAIAYASSHLVVEQIQLGLLPADDPSLLLKTLNRLLNQTLHGKICMTFMALLIDNRNQKLTFCNGGHPHPLLIPSDKSDPRLSEFSQRRKQAFRLLIPKKQSNNLLGIDAEASFCNDTIDLKPGDKIMLFTDGLTEAKNAQGLQWGLRGLQRSINACAEQDSSSLCEAIIKDVTNFNAQGEQFADDLILLIVEFHAKQMLAKSS